MSEENTNDRCEPCELAVLIGQGEDLCRRATELDCEELTEQAITERIPVRELLVKIKDAIDTNNSAREEAETLIWIHDKAAEEGSE